MYATTMFVAGFLGNLICQAARAMLNIVASVLAFALAATRLLLGSLMILGGGWRKGADLCASAWEAAKISGASLAVGCVQGLGAATLVTPMLRGAQASSEKFSMQGVYAPNAPNRTKGQNVFGLNSWEAPPQEQKTEIELPAIKEEVKKKVRRTNVATATKPKRSSKEWEELAHKYLESRTSGDADRIRYMMATKHPLLYLKALRAARSRMAVR